MNLPYNAPVKRYSWFSREYGQIERIVDFSGREIFEIALTSRDLSYEKNMGTKLDLLVDLLNGKKQVKRAEATGIYEIIENANSQIKEVNETQVLTEAEANIAPANILIEPEQKLELEETVSEVKLVDTGSFIESAKKLINNIVKKGRGRPRGSFGKKKMRALREKEKVNV